MIPFNGWIGETFYMKEKVLALIVSLGGREE